MFRRVITEDGGFVLHDLRRNFASGLIQHTDIKTAQEFLGHSKIANTAIYLKTDERRMSQAIRRASGIGVKREIIALYSRPPPKNSSARVS